MRPIVRASFASGLPTPPAIEVNSEAQRLMQLDSGSARELAQALIDTAALADAVNWTSGRVEQSDDELVFHLAGLTPEQKREARVLMFGIEQGLFDDVEVDAGAIRAALVERGVYEAYDAARAARR